MSIFGRWMKYILNLILRLICDSKFGKTCWNINILGINYIILIIIEYSGILSD